MIDRSKPHEPQNLIAKVSELKKLHGMETAPIYSASEGEFTYECAVLNAAPELLDVLGEIRAGDADILYWMLTGIGDDPTQEEINALLERYRDMAWKMEADR